MIRSTLRDWPAASAEMYAGCGEAETEMSGASTAAIVAKRTAAKSMEASYGGASEKLQTGVHDRRAGPDGHEHERRDSRLQRAHSRPRRIVMHLHMLADAQGGNRRRGPPRETGQTEANARASIVPAVDAIRVLELLPPDRVRVAVEFLDEARLANDSPRHGPGPA